MSRAIAGTIARTWLCAWASAIVVAGALGRAESRPTPRPPRCGSLPPATSSLRAGAHEALYARDQGPGNADLRRLGPTRRANQGRPRSTSCSRPTWRSSRTWPRRDWFVPPRSSRMPGDRSSSPSVASRKVDQVVERPDTAGRQEDRVGEPRVRTLRDRRQASARARGTLEQGFLEDRSLGDGPPGTPIRRVGQRRRRVRRRSRAQGRRRSASLRSIPSSTTR